MLDAGSADGRQKKKVDCTGSSSKYSSGTSISFFTLLTIGFLIIACMDSMGQVPCQLQPHGGVKSLSARFSACTYLTRDGDELLFIDRFGFHCRFRHQNLLRRHGPGFSARGVVYWYTESLCTLPVVAPRTKVLQRCSQTRGLPRNGLRLDMSTGRIPGLG